jgi:hypothetical protein
MVSPGKTATFAGLRVLWRFTGIIFNPFFSHTLHLVKSGPFFTQGMENPFLLYPDQPEQANKYELSLEKVWTYLLQEFRDTDVAPRWRWASIVPHRSRSLLSLVITAPYTISEIKLWYIATSFYWGSAQTSHPFQCRGVEGSCSRHSLDDFLQHCRMDSVVKQALGIYEHRVTKHSPSLIDVFIWNDYDLLPPAYSDTLFDLGYRHSFLYFVELRILSSMLMISLFLFLAIYPLLQVYFHVRGSAVFLTIIVVALPAVTGFLHSLAQLIHFWSHWCESGNFLWPMIFGRQVYTGYSLRTVCTTLTRVFYRRSKQAEVKANVGLRTLS